MAKFKNENELETYVRKLIKRHITRYNNHIYALKNKKAVDILICKDTRQSQLFFIEIKFYQKKHCRLGFGGPCGVGFQP